MQISIRRILFPTDFSTQSQSAKNYAYALATAFQAELHVLHVTLDPQPLPGSTGIHLIPQRDVTADLVKAANAQMAAEVSDEWKTKIKLTCACRLGEPVREIINYADTHEIDLIVLGTHGRTGLSHVLIGSVAEKVVRLAKCPVLSVHPTLNL